LQVVALVEQDQAVEVVVEWYITVLTRLFPVLSMISL
tara:strand:- start:396 stop:506 length:111 start_codon:yes stop_codon:yes gene_type:complete